LTPDLINGLFEASGACAVGLSVLRIMKDRRYSGMHPFMTVFFQTWGLWNLYYYPSINQPWSTAGGVLLALANTLYLSQMWRFRHGPRP